ncbi:heparan-alpha-glucosaminide N-acetyltransferase-like [Heracleum sosnowskyi]|uniref:Heparan-alpha-glucosaminide N-acetyltransferase-like n=1 Tax=Heracleum sosnowskyi TaxID=360622 RepID=A0AAD8JJP1_9APIA|nr:heparan-alpha-glucosaminide N-acetyltransferase-like [Heracleum sosnowskyi]
MEDPKKVEEGFGYSDNYQGTYNEYHNEVKKDQSTEHEKQLEKRVAPEHMPSMKLKDDDPQLAFTTSKPKNKRVASLDAFRGLAIVLMMLVDDAGGVYPRIDHAPWNGCTLADFVMPFFLFIVGLAVALALKRVPKMTVAIKRIFIRTIKLMFWGILLQGGYSHTPYELVYGVDMKKIRWFGILQRIAFVYMVIALIEALTVKLRPTVLNPGHLAIFKAYRWQWFGGLVAFLVYMITTYTLYVPDWSFNGPQSKVTVRCGMRGHLGPACNAVGYVDRQVWGINHIYSGPAWIRLKACTLSSPSSGTLRDDAPTWCLGPFEPEGLLSTISAVLSGTIGIHYGHILIHFKGHAERLKQWASTGLGLLVFAIILHFTDAIPINKQLYSFSYVCFTAGAAGILFSAFYMLIDVWGIRAPFLFLEWIGMNAMLVFVLGAQGVLAGFVKGWFYEKPENNLVSWILDHVFIDVWNSEKVGTLLYVIFAEITFWGVLSGILHKFGIYWKL